MCEDLPKYLEDPKIYCSRIDALLEQNSKEWQNVWKAAIPELSNLAASEISVINALLKPIESAFKSKDGNIRVQAFECWSHFIVQCENVIVSDKLWNVLLVPLCAHNHSLYVVLSAKLKTWDTFVDTSFTSRPTIMNKAISSILKVLYGPHSLPPASNFTKLSEPCGKLYHKIMMKCAPFDDQIHNIFSYLEHAIPPLSNLEHTRKLANVIWSDALKIICSNNWKIEYFEYLMRTLQSLLSDSKNDGYHLISNFLYILFSIYEPFPPDRLTPHLSLTIRCLFRSPVDAKVVGEIMHGMIKRCENPSICFTELDKELKDKINYDNKDIDVLWMAIASCYTKWLKNDSSDPEFCIAVRIFLFPFDQMNEFIYETERFDIVMKRWKTCYEECTKSIENKRFLQVLLENLEVGIDNNIPRLMVATLICQSIHAIVKTSDEPVPCKNVLLKISKNMPDLKTLMDSNLKSYAAKYLTTVLALIQLDPTCSKDFSNVVKNLDEVSVSSKNGLDSDSSSKSAKEGSSCDKITTPLPKRTTLLERFSSPASKKSKLDSPVRAQTTPRISKIDEDDVQLVEIKPTSKNSPMTQNQLEKAKNKRYIPALYQDLSQSQSQSLSQCESESIFSGIKKPNKEINPDLFEENANLPSVVSDSSASPAIPPTLSFHTGLNSPISERSSSFLSKKSLFNEGKKKSEKVSDSDGSIEVIQVKKSLKDDTNNHPADTSASNDRETDKQTSKRKIPKEGELLPVKRSKRLSMKNENNVDNKSNQKSRKSTTTPLSAQKIEKNEPTVIDLVETDSQNVFLPANSRPVSGVSSPLNSLMNLKDGKNESSAKRKSLRAKKNNAPSTSQVTLRRRNSSTLDSDSKKSTDSDDSYDGRQSTGDKRRRSKQNKPSNSSAVHVVHDIEPPHQIDSIPAKSTLNQKPYDESSVEKRPAVAEDNSSTKVMSTPNKSPPTDEKEHADIEKSTSKVVGSQSNSSQTDSVILLEDCGAEVITINDSELPTSLKKVTESKTVEDASEESTFFEGSDQNVSNKNLSEVVPNGENISKENVSSVIQSEAIANSAEIQKLAISPEIISSVSIVSLEEKGNDVDTCTNQRTVEPNEIANNSSTSVSNLDHCDAEMSDESVKNLQQSSTTENTDDELVIDKSTSSDGNSTMSANLKDKEKVANEKVSSPVENCDKELKSNEDSVDKKRKKDDGDNISSIHGYSRGSQLTKLAQGSNYLLNGLKPAKTTSPKPGKSRFIGKLQGAYPSPNVSRAMKMFENKTLQTTPTKSATTPLEEKRTFTYTPKECISPGILKRFDGVKNTSPPKSPKVVNFADNLTHVRYFEDNDGSDSDSMLSTGDKLSNENLMNNEPPKSQDMLYSQLQNCRDHIDKVVELIFGSAGSANALDYFLRIGVNTVGDLASMSTLTASSIPSGDNRVSRLREKLKQYDAKMEREGRRCSARRRILKSQGDSENREVSCLINLLDEAEFSNNDDGSINDDERETLVDVNQKSSDEISSEDTTENIPENNAIDVKLNDDRHPVIRKPDENKTENNKAKDEEAVVISSNKFEKPNLKPMDSVMVVIEDCNVVKETENKENVDPSLDAMAVETVLESSNISNHEVEPMEVETQPCDIPKITNETINESADYVCTDSTTFEQNTTDRRSVTVHNIHRYSTGIEPIIREAGSEASVSTENAPTEAVIVINESDSTNESVSIFAENKIITSAEKVTKSPEILQSAIESVIVTPSVGQNVQNEALKECVDVINDNDNSASESISIFAESKIVTITREAIESQTTSHSTSVDSVIVTPPVNQDQQNNSLASDCQNMEQTTEVVSELQQEDHDHHSEQNMFENLLKRYTGSWIDLMKIIYPHYPSSASEEEARKIFLEFHEKIKTTLLSHI